MRRTSLRTRIAHDAAEYLGDITTDRNGYADNTFKAIIDEAFDGEQVRVDLDQVGSRFADPGPGGAGGCTCACPPLARR